MGGRFPGFFVLVSCLVIGYSFGQQCNSQDFKIAYNGQTAFTVSSLNGTCECASYYSSGRSIFDGGIGSNSSGTTIYGGVVLPGTLSVSGGITTAGSVTSSGALSVSGGITSGSVTSSGSGAFSAGLSSNSLDVSADAAFHGNVTISGGVELGASLAVGSSAGTCANSLADGLVFWLTGDGLVGDSSPSAVPVTNYGASCGMTVAGVANVCMFGTGNYMTLDLTTVLTKFPFGLAPRSMCAWATMPATLPNVKNWIMSYGTATTGNAFYLGASSANAITAGAYGDDITNGAWVPNTWTHVCNVYDGSNARLYINGALSAFVVKPGWLLSRTAVVAAPFEAYVGSQAVSPAAEFWRGAMYDLRLYNRALSASDVLNLKLATAGNADGCAYPPSASSVLLNVPVSVTESFTTASSSTTTIGGSLSVTAPATFSSPVTFQGSSTTFTAAVNFGAQPAAGVCANTLNDGLLFQLGSTSSTPTDAGPHGIGVSGSVTCSQTVGGVSGVCSFSGSNYLTLSTTAAPFPVAALSRTMCGWAYATSFANNMWLLAYGTASTGSASYLGVISPSGVIEFGGYGGVPPDVQGTVLSLNTWTHLCGTYDGATATIYVNGQYVTSASRAWNTVANLTFVGTMTATSPTENWRGSMYDVRAYSRVLSPTEVAMLYTATRGNADPTAACAYTVPGSVTVTAPFAVANSLVTGPSSTTAIGGTLTVPATTTFTGPTTFAGAVTTNQPATFNAAVNLAAGSSVSGASTFTGAVTITSAGGLTVNSAAGVTVNSGGVTVSTGGLSVSGTSNLGAITSSGGIAVNSVNGVTVSGGLTVTGVSTLGAATFGGVVSANQAATFNAAFTAGSTATFSGTSTFNGAVTVNAGLTVSSASGITVNTGGISVGAGGISVTGTSTLAAVTSSGGITVNSANGVTVNTGGLSVAALSTFSSATFSGAVGITSSGGLTVTSASGVTVNTGGLTVAGTSALAAVTSSGGITVNSGNGVTVNTGGLSVAGTGSFGNTLSVARPAGATSNTEATFAAGSQTLFVMNNIAGGSYNPMSQTGDHALIFSDGTMGTGSLVIAPWNSQAYGLRYSGTTGRLGINTASPSSVLHVNGDATIATTLTAKSITTSNQKAYFTQDTRSGCPAAGYPVGSTLFSQTITLQTSAYVMSHGQLIRNWQGRCDLFINIDGGTSGQSIVQSSVSAWQGGHVSWAGQLGAGSHTISLVNGYCEDINGNVQATASPWGCNAGWGSISTLVVG